MYVVAGLFCLLVFVHAGIFVLNVLSGASGTPFPEFLWSILILIPASLLAVGYALVGFGRVRGNEMTAISLFIFYMYLPLAFLAMLVDLFGTLAVIGSSFGIFVLLSIPAPFLIIGMVANLFKSQSPVIKA